MRRASFIFGAGLAWLASVSGLSVSSATAEDGGIWEREKLTGDWGGVRTALKDKGIDFTFNYIGETLSVRSGGIKRGTTFEGRFDGMVDLDLEKLSGWTGGHIQVRAFQIHRANGENAATLAGSLADPSNIDALPTTRLFTAWFQQDFGKSGSVRAGLLAADDEFATSTTAGGLINGTFGWPVLMAANLPSGGPAYPLASPGIRLQINPTENTSLLAAVFGGDPAGRDCTRDPQECNRYGTTFSLSARPLFMAEAQYQANQEKDATGLAAAYKIGFWYHADEFADQRFGLDGFGNTQLLASDPTLAPFVHHGNWGVYGVIDQMLWRSKTASTSVFLRGGLTPDERNMVSWYVDGGIGFKGLIPGRGDDTLTLGAGYSRISPQASAFDRDTLLINGPPYPVRDYELVLEASYIWQIAPWWSIQPDIQYIMHAGGNVPHPDNPAATLGNILIVGARTSITF
ncbi:MAG: carbohydrate porin [Pseudorhodoplanes sp.]